MGVTNPDNEKSGMTEYERRMLALEEAKLSGGCSSMGWPVGCLIIILATILACLLIGPFGLIVIPIGLIAFAMSNSDRKARVRYALNKDLEKPENDKTFHRPVRDRWGWTHRRGWTYLHYAAMRGDVAQARTLIKNGADVNAKENLEGRTPLQVAQAHDKHDMVEFLKKAGGV